MLEGGDARWGFDPKGLEHAVGASPTQFLKDGFIFADGLGVQDVISPTLHRGFIDLCTKGTRVKIQNEIKKPKHNTRENS